LRREFTFKTAVTNKSVTDVDVLCNRVLAIVLRDMFHNTETTANKLANDRPIYFPVVLSFYTMRIVTVLCAGVGE